MSLLLNELIYYCIARYQNQQNLVHAGFHFVLSSPINLNSSSRMVGTAHHPLMDKTNSLYVQSIQVKTDFKAAPKISSNFYLNSG